jgi:hypothetical protein
MLIAPAIMMTPPTPIIMPSPPIPTNSSRHLPISPVPPFDPFDLIPAHLRRPMAFSVFIAVVIAAIVGKDDRGKRG